MFSDDEDDLQTLDNRIEEAVKRRFDSMVLELVDVVQQYVDKCIQYVVEDRLGALRAAVLSTLTNEYTLVNANE